MNHTTLTLLTCAALAAPSIALAEEAQETRQDPRAQVTKGLGPQPRRVSLLPPPADVRIDSNTFNPYVVTTSMVGGGIALGGLTGFLLSGGANTCHETPTDPFHRTISATVCVFEISRSLLMGAAGGMIGAMAGGLASVAVNDALRARLQVAPVVTGSGTAGVSLSGSF